jgi:hypothetical protein
MISIHQQFDTVINNIINNAIIEPMRVCEFASLRVCEFASLRVCESIKALINYASQAPLNAS